MENHKIEKESADKVRIKELSGEIMKLQCEKWVLQDKVAKYEKVIASMAVAVYGGKY